MKLKILLLLLLITVVSLRRKTSHLKKSKIHKIHKTRGSISKVVVGSAFNLETTDSKNQFFDKVEKKK